MLRFAIVLIAITIIYYVYDIIFNGLTPSVFDFVNKLYNTGIRELMWFLYNYISFLIMLPILRKLVKGLKSVDYECIIIINLIVGSVIPIIQFIVGKGELSLNSSLSPVLFTTRNVFFALIGYYFEHVFSYENFKAKNKRLIIFSVVGIVISEIMTIYEHSVNSKCGIDSNLGFTGTFSSVLAIALFVFIKKWISERQISEKCANVISTIGQCTFGIYLFEAMIREKTLFIFLVLQKNIKVIPASFVWVTLCYIIGLGITYILRKVPYVKKLYKIKRFMDIWI